jgi:hypothetical protein
MPSAAAQNLLYAMSGIKWPALDWRMCELGGQQLRSLAPQVPGLRGELMTAMSQVRTSAAKGKTISAWLASMEVAVGSGHPAAGSGAAELAALPHLEALLGGTACNWSGAQTGLDSR